MCSMLLALLLALNRQRISKLFYFSLLSGFMVNLINISQAGWMLSRARSSTTGDIGGRREGVKVNGKGQREMIALNLSRNELASDKQLPVRLVNLNSKSN